MFQHVLKRCLSRCDEAGVRMEHLTHFFRRACFSVDQSNSVEGDDLSCRLVFVDCPEIVVLGATSDTRVCPSG